MTLDKDISNSSTPSGSVTFSVAWWRLALRIATLLIMLALNYALIGSTLEHRTSGLNLRADLLSLLVLLFFNLTVLLPALIQVSAVETTAEGMTVKTLLWRSQLKWTDIAGFSRPATASFAILRGKRCVYLMVRRDFAHFDDLARIISSQIKH